MRFRSFQRGTVGLFRSKESRATDCQSWRSKKILPIGPAQAKQIRTGPLGRIFFKPPTLMAGSSAVLWPTKTHSTSLERSKPPLLTQTLSKSLAALLMHFISLQSTLISIGFISKGAVFVGPICMINKCWKFQSNILDHRKVITN